MKEGRGKREEEGTSSGEQQSDEQKQSHTGVRWWKGLRDEGLTCYFITSGVPGEEIFF